jgi:hypothetical protein
LVVDRREARRVGYVGGSGSAVLEAINLDQPNHPFQLQALSNVRPLRPIRVLFAGRDPRYLRVMAFLLARRGYETRRSTKDAVLFADVESFQPDIVILAEGTAFGDTVGQAVALLGRSDNVSVIVSTSREDAPSGNRLRFVQRWGSFDSLVDAVERAWADIPPAVER